MQTMMMSDLADETRVLRPLKAYRGTLRGELLQPEDLSP
jgi:hypothetical protein